jgi:hypothetical protein
MTVELHLPDLPEVPLCLRWPARCAGRAPRAAQPWPACGCARRPVVLPAAAADGAAGAGHLVAGEEHAAAAGARPEPRRCPADPDYTMTRFAIERFDARRAAGAAHRRRALRHYPATDRSRSTARASAPPPRRPRDAGHRAPRVANGDGSEVQLLGGAQVTSKAPRPRRWRCAASSCMPSCAPSGCVAPAGAGAPWQHAARPAGLEYDHLSAAELLGPVRARARLAGPHGHGRQRADGPRT